MILPLIDREWYDILIVCYIAGFMFLKSAWIGREAALGRAMATTNAVLGTTYVWSLLVGFFNWRGPLVAYTDTLLHILVAIAVSWCVRELWVMRMCR